MTPPEILTQSELQAVSGYVQSAAIRRWLESHGVRYLRSRNGVPHVRRDDLQPASKTVELNLEVLRGTRRQTA